MTNTLEPEWQWEAHYLDGTVLYQQGHKFTDIDFLNLRTFNMVHPTKDPFILMWRPGMKLIHFYRHLIAHKAEGEVRCTIYCFGYENENIKFILAVLPDGVVVTDNIDNLKVHL